jgi:hypothetical protein
VAQRTVARHAPERLLVALDPVNLEKPYTRPIFDIEQKFSYNWLRSDDRQPLDMGAAYLQLDCSTQDVVHSWI